MGSRRSGQPRTFTLLTRRSKLSLYRAAVQGTVLGVTYFVAPRKHGTFVRRENLSLYDQEVEASVRVQGALRMSIARRRARNELTQRAFNALDADEEVSHLCLAASGRSLQPPLRWFCRLGTLQPCAQHISPPLHIVPVVRRCARHIWSATHAAHAACGVTRLPCRPACCAAGSS